MKIVLTISIIILIFVIVILTGLIYSYNVFLDEIKFGKRKSNNEQNSESNN